VATPVRNRKTVAEILEARQSELLVTWLEQIRGGTGTPTLKGTLELMTEAQFRTEAADLLQSLAAALGRGEYEDITQGESSELAAMLRHIGSSRAEQGSTPTETATLVLALKDSLLPYLQEEYGSTPKRLIAEFVKMNKVIDQLLLVTFESFVDERENMIAQKSLSLLTEELARSNKDLEQFAYVASHDLQEPLRNIASSVQFLERRYKGQLDDAADKFIGYAVDGANRMQVLISDLLEHARVGSSGGSFEPVESETCLYEAIANLKATIEDSGTLVTHNDLPTVTADTTQLAQLFQNLIGNAIKFRREESLGIHVSAEREGHEWVFCLKDNGIGIAPEYHERIFLVFQRLHSRAEYPGTGIGLAICKKIVERHEGRIWVESESGKGSAFYFTIPIITTREVSDHDRHKTRQAH